MIKILNTLLLTLVLTSCVKIPDGVTPVSDFDINRYMGKWYEVARLDHSFERGLNNVTAQYSLNKDGTVAVINRGYSDEKQTWKEADGKAKFVKSNDLGYLKVSFFGPFYGAYIVFDLDKENYQHAYVSGPDKSYLWLLSRTPEISESLKNDFIIKSKNLGFKTDELIFVEHDKP